MTAAAPVKKVAALAKAARERAEMRLKSNSNCEVRASKQRVIALMQRPSGKANKTYPIVPAGFSRQPSYHSTVTRPGKYGDRNDQKMSFAFDASMPLAGNLAVQRLLNSKRIQAKLNISSPTDPDEVEADAVAESVISASPAAENNHQNTTESAKSQTSARLFGSAQQGTSTNGGSRDFEAGKPGRIARPPISKSHRAVQRKCAVCGNQDLPCPKCGEEKNRVNRKQLPQSTAIATGAFPEGLGLRTSGQPLPSSVREFFERQFAYDFSVVRVHSDRSAAESARSIQASAYTMGQHVVFGEGEFVPGTQRGQKLLAHELTHVVQQAAGTRLHGVIQRQQAPGAQPGVIHGADPVPPPVLRPDAERVFYKGVLLADDRTFMHSELRALIARDGLTGADAWMEDRPGVSTVPVFFPGHLGATPALQPRTPLDAARDDQNKAAQQRLVPRLLPIAREVYRDKTRPEAVKFLEDFDKQAKTNAESTLKANEEQAKAEGIRYGLTSQQIDRIVYKNNGRGGRVGVKEQVTKYDMDKTSPAAGGLKDAAKVLLDRRREIDKKVREQQTHVKSERDPTDPKGRILVPDAQYSVIGKEIEDKKTAYNNLRSVLAAEYPVLAAFSEVDKDSGNLEVLAQKGAGPDMAGVIGQEIARKQANIDKVREGLKNGDVNLYRQPKMVDLTRVQLGAKEDPMKRRLIDDKVESEQPGVLFELALGVLNIAALLLAGPTGGGSLVIAAGVNVVVTASHIQDYLMQSALSGTAFDKAQAISAEEPSLFWLAVEIVGTGLDVGPAAATLLKVSGRWVRWSRRHRQRPRARRR
jgi:hypothetical protein